MISTCTITRSSDEKTWDEGTGTYTPAEPLVIYTGRCKMQDNSRAVAEVLAGERRAAINPLELHLPIDGSGGVRRGDSVRIDANPNDSALVGRRFTVQAEGSGTTKTARRLPIEAVM
jgi:hypothetical protein